MKKILIRTLSVVTTLSILFLSVSLLPSFAANEMAFNIYSNPNTSGTSGRFTTFAIDFLSDDTADGTYWALANFGLYMSKKTLKAYKNISGGGAYAGMQDGAYAKHYDGSYYYNPDGTLFRGKVGILSFWDMKYKDGAEEIVMTATRVYPRGESTFGGEGEGTNCIMPYAWEDSRWYRMVLHCWEDVENGTTFVGEWFQDRETGEWRLFAYFDTHLYESLLIGGMGLFMENFSSSTKNQIRTFNTKNIYVQDARNGEWVSLPTCNISYGDGGSANKIGMHEFGATDEYFWGKTGGVVEDQKAYDAANPTKSASFTITQPDKPTFGDQTTPTVSAKKEKNDIVVTWENSATSTPQLSYTLEVYANGEKVAEKAQTRPEVTTCTIENIEAEEFKCVLTVTDLFGNTVSSEYATEGYGIEPEPTVEEVLASAPFVPAKLVVWALTGDKEQ